MHKDPWKMADSRQRAQAAAQAGMWLAARELSANKVMLPSDNFAMHITLNLKTASLHQSIRLEMQCLSPSSTAALRSSKVLGPCRAPALLGSSQAKRSHAAISAFLLDLAFHDQSFFGKATHVLPGLRVASE